MEDRPNGSAGEERLHFVIVGAGICGFAVARALRPHHRVTILERSTLNEETGAAILSPSPATRILESWGFDFTKIQSPPCKAVREFKGDGTKVLDIEQRPIEMFGAQWYMNHRVDLHRQLRELALDQDGPGEPASLRLGVHIASVDCESARVTLDTGEVIQGDAVIGCDGIRSFVRDIVLGSATYRAAPSGTSAYRMLLDAKKVLADPELAFLVADSSLTLIRSDDRRLVAYPCRGLTQLNMAALFPDSECGQVSTENWTAGGDLAEMRKLYESYAPKWQRLLAMADNCKLWQLRDQDPLPRWTRGRTIILGDAAHPMLPHQGSGGAMAIEDAEAMGYVFGSASPAARGASVEERLKMVEKIRYQRASTLQQYSRSQAVGMKALREAGLPEQINSQQFAKYVFGYKGAPSVSILPDEEFDAARASQKILQHGNILVA